MAKRSEDNASWVPDLSGGVPRSKRAADFVFEKLAGAILRRELKPGTLLPGERELAEKFDISRVTIREAIHKLRELDLVLVRRGGQTIILDADESNNPLLIGIVMELAGPEDLAVREMYERQLVQGLSLLALVEGRIQPASIAELERIVSEHEANPGASHVEFIRAFWTIVSRAAKNQFMWREATFWFDVAARRGSFDKNARLDHATRVGLHREIVRRLRDRDDAATFFLRMIRPLLETFTVMTVMNEHSVDAE